MGFVRGLAAINAVMDGQKKTFDSDSEKVRWLKLNDGDSFKVRFPNELDEDSPAFDENRGLAVVISEHTSPEDFRIKAQCTKDTEGKCWACEQDEAHPKEGWRARLRFYTNVLVNDGVEDPYVAVWSQSVSTRSAFNVLREYAIDMGSVSNLTWKLKRNGTGTDTSYVLMPLGADAEPFDWSNAKLFNLEKVVREVSYSSQEAFYLKLGGEQKQESTSAEIPW